jgi:hypothetical protein
MATTIAAAGDLIYGTANDAYAALSLGTAGKVLKVNSGATAPEWAVDPTTDVVTTAGDLIYGTGADAVARLGLGTASQYLRVNSGATAPEWATLSAGGMTLISETVANNNSTLTFSSIPGTYKQLLLVYSGVFCGGGSTVHTIRLNGDSGSNYAQQGMELADGSSNVRDYSNQSSIRTTNSTSFGSNVQEGGSPGENMWRQLMGTLLIDNYASNSKYKTYTSNYSYFDSLNNIGRRADIIGIYKITSAITEINIVRLSGSQNLYNDTNTSIRLYGIS